MLSSASIRQKQLKTPTYDLDRTWRPVQIHSKSCLMAVERQQRGRYHHQFIIRADLLAYKFWHVIGIQGYTLYEYICVYAYTYNLYQAKTSSNKPANNKTKRVVCPQKISLAACPSGRRAGWAVRRFDSLVLSEVPDAALCLCAQGDGAFLRTAPQRYKPIHLSFA